MTAHANWWKDDMITLPMQNAETMFERLFGSKLTSPAGYVCFADALRDMRRILELMASLDGVALFADIIQRLQRENQELSVKLALKGVGRAE